MATRAEPYDLMQAGGRETATSQLHSREETSVLGMDAEGLARALGWFGIGLGVAEVVAPRSVAWLSGTRDHAPLLRGYGVRELAAGLGILTRPKPAPWVWSRVAGDVLDIASLLSALGSRGNARGRTAAVLAAVGGVTALDILCARKLSSGPGGATGRMPLRAEANVIVGRPPDECYRMWRDFENLPRFMSYLQTVRITGDKRSHWVARAPGDVRVEWDADMLEDLPNQRISWRTVPGSQFFNSGSVEFEPAPGERGTIVRVQMDYGHPGQAMTSVLGKLLGKDPEQLVYKDLRRFKQVLETGEVITTEGQSAGRNSGATWLDSIAR